MGFLFRVIDNFIDTCDSDYIIDHYRDKLTPSCVIGDTSLRNSDDFYIDGIDKSILTCWIRENRYYLISRDSATEIIEKYSKQILINILQQYKK